MAYPEILDMGPYCSTAVLSNGCVSTVYSLDFVVCQHGSPQGGHYWCLQRVPGGQFLVRNDAEEVRLQTAQQALSHQAYVCGLLFSIQSTR